MRRKKSNAVVAHAPPDAVKAEPKPVLTPEEKAKAKEAKKYWTPATQQAIIDFQIADKAKDYKERDRLYVSIILPSCQKLVENLINIYRFSSLHDTYDDLKNDCINFLYETLNKFDSTRGTNSFSYMNICAKHYLIIRTKQKSTRSKRSVSLDDPDALTINEQLAVEEHSTVPSQDIVLENASSVKVMMMTLYEIRNKVKTENELACINSIITIFENIDDIDFLNKSAILLYMRELSGLTPKQLTTAMQSVRKSYKHLKIDPLLKLF
jgi:hypothetical protein